MLAFGARRRSAAGAARRAEGGKTAETRAQSRQPAPASARETSTRREPAAHREKPAPTLMQRAVAFLARREHSRVELRLKLLRQLPPDGEPEAVERVLDQLVAKDMLSDTRFIQSRLRVRAGRYGVARIRQELRQHELEPGVLRDALQPLAESEFDRAWAAWDRKFGIAPADEKQRARQMRFLAARGFGLDTITQVIKRARAPSR